MVSGSAMIRSDLFCRHIDQGQQPARGLCLLLMLSLGIKQNQRQNEFLYMRPLKEKEMQYAH